jgi:hypothetical protein
VSNARWSERLSANGMEQVRELLGLFDREHLDGVCVAWSFVTHRIHSCKQREHPANEYRDDTTDGTCEVPERIDREQAKERMAGLFNLNARKGIDNPPSPFSVGNLPPTYDSSELVRAVC